MVGRKQVSALLTSEMESTGETQLSPEMGVRCGKPWKRFGCFRLRGAQLLRMCVLGGVAREWSKLMHYCAQVASFLLKCYHKQMAVGKLRVSTGLTVSSKVVCGRQNTIPSVSFLF